MAAYVNFLMSFKQKIEEAVTLVPDMSAEQKLKAVQHWNGVSEKLQDIVNSSAADIGALALLENKEEEKDPVEDMDINNVHNGLSPNPSLTDLAPAERIPLEPISNNPYEDPIANTPDSINCNENQMEHQTPAETVNCVEDSIPESSKKNSPKKLLTLSKKLAVLKEKESEVFTPDLLADKAYAEVSDVANQEMNPPKSFGYDDNTSLEIDLQDNSSQSIEENTGKENSAAAIDAAINLDQVLPTTKAHFSSHQKPFLCENCNLRFSTKANLAVHKRRHTGERPFSCEICFSTFTTQGNLKRHKNTHTGEKPFQCTQCEKRFTEKKTLKVHMRKHTGERPFKCTMCEQTFAQIGVLQSHLSKHLNTRDYLCDLCGKTFRQKSQLRLHQMRHDGAKKFNCPECDMKFITRGDMERHIRRHTGEKPYVCDLCGKTFTRQQSLNEHKNRHLGRKPYQCKYCDKTFHEMSGCYKHIKSHCAQNEVNTSTGIDQKNDAFMSSTIIDNHNPNELTVGQNFNPSQGATVQDPCPEQLIQVDGYSNSSKYLLIQTDLSSENPTTTNHMTISENLVPTSSPCENISVVQFSVFPTTS